MTTERSERATTGSKSKTKQPRAKLSEAATADRKIRVKKGRRRKGHLGVLGWLEPGKSHDYGIVHTTPSGKVVVIEPKEGYGVIVPAISSTEVWRKDLRAYLSAYLSGFSASSEEPSTGHERPPEVEEPEKGEAGISANVDALLERLKKGIAVESAAMDNLLKRIRLITPTDGG